MISMAGAALGGDSVLWEQNYVALRMSGLSEKVAGDYCKTLKKVLHLMSEDNQGVSGQLEDILNEVELPAQLKENLRLVQKTMTPWLDYFVRYNPAEDISGVKCPVMVINGSLDMQVLPSSNLAAFEKLLPKGKKTWIKKYPGLNHLFQHCVLGTVAEYGRIEETLSEEVLRDVTEWVQGLQ